MTNKLLAVWFSFLGLAATVSLIVLLHDGISQQEKLVIVGVVAAWITIGLAAGQAAAIFDPILDTIKKIFSRRPTRPRS